MKRTTISEETIADVATKLANLPKKAQPKSTAQAIEELKPKLIQAMKNGYTLEELRDFLEQNGVKTTVATLRVYLSKPKEKRSGQKTQSMKPNSHGKRLASDAKGTGSSFSIRPDRLEI